VESFYGQGWGIFSGGDDGEMAVLRLVNWPIKWARKSHSPAVRKQAFMP